jgi:DNA mismatch endonuclease (patch repair protein)
MTPEQRSRAMKRVKLRNGPLEMVVRRCLTNRGLRYRCNVRSLPGSPDIVFARQRVAVFVDGDFWHGWRLPAWEHKLSSFWRDKLRANRERDLRNFRRLRSRGWRVVRIWQHNALGALERSVDRIERALVERADSAATRGMIRARPVATAARGRRNSQKKMR